MSLRNVGYLQERYYDLEQLVCASVPELEGLADAASDAGAARGSVTVGGRAMTRPDDAAGTVSAIVGALGLGAGKTSNAAPAFVERRTELDEKAVEALD